MKIWFDTEFIEDGRTIELISIGMVREDGAAYYAETDQYRPGKASQWVKDNVLVHLKGGVAIKPLDVIGREIIDFAGDDPEFWAYYADYDWVALCQLFGTMMQLPSGWPMFCRDVKQLCVSLGDPELPSQTSVEHHALNDAKWTKTAWEFLQSYPQRVASAQGSTSNITDAMCEAAIDADAPDHIQGFSYSKRNVIRDVWADKELWSAPVGSPDDYQSFQRQCQIERMRRTLEAALSVAPAEGATDRGQFASLRAANEVRQREWDVLGQLTLAYRGNELAGEVGEACNVIKKLERERLGINGSRDTVEHLAEELADVIICTDLIAMQAGIDLEGAVVAKFNASSEKVGLKTRMVRRQSPAASAEETPQEVAEQAAYFDAHAERFAEAHTGIAAQCSSQPVIDGAPEHVGAIHDALRKANVEFAAFSTDGKNLFGDRKSIQAAAEAFHSHSIIDDLKTQIQHWREECGKLHSRLSAVSSTEGTADE